MTHLRYFDSNMEFSGSAIVLSASKDENGHYVILSETIFYPQGGGQPFDIGFINDIPVHAVRWVEKEVRHYINQDAANLVRENVTMAIDKERRILNSRLHTGGHLLSHVVETLYPHLKAVKGHHYTDGPYVEFTSLQMVDLDIVNKEIAINIAKDLAISTQNNTPQRLVSIGHFPAQFCGGTHVSSLFELKGLLATKQKCKSTHLRISYNLQAN